MPTGAAIAEASAQPGTVRMGLISCWFGTSGRQSVRGRPYARMGRRRRRRSRPRPGTLVPALPARVELARADRRVRTYPMQLTLAVFDLPDRSVGDEAAVPELAVDR